MEKIKSIDNNNNKKITENFFKKIVELENIHQKNKLIGGFNDKKVIEDLATLYKNCVEYYHNKSKEKENYFYDKLQILLSNEKVIKLMSDSNEEIDIKRTFSFRKQKKFKNIYATQFKITMNKINMNSSENTVGAFDLKNENNENYEKGVQIINSNIEEQENNFRLKLEKAKKEKKRFSLLIENGNGNVDNKMLSLTSPKKINRERHSELITRDFSLLSSGNFDLDNNNNMSFANNSNLSIVNKRNKSINLFIEKFLFMLSHKYFQKFHDVTLKNLMKLFEENYENKKEVFLEYEDELASFDGFFDKETNTYEKSMQLIVDSLILERNEKIESENIILFEELKKLVEIGKMDKISNNDDDFIEYIDDLKNKIMNIILV